MGWRISPEAARHIIQHNVSTGGNALPWGNLEAFRDAMLETTEKEYLEAKKLKGVVFFDRGWPDSEVCPFADETLERLKPLCYHKKVFVFPPWDAIYRQDAERKQTLEEAHESCNRLCESYKKLGYELLEVPQATVQARAQWILRQLDLL